MVSRSRLRLVLTVFATCLSAMVLVASANAAGPRVKLFDLPGAFTTAGALAVGPTGDIWMTASRDDVGRIIRMTPAGEARELALPDEVHGGLMYTSRSAVTPDAVWFSAMRKDSNPDQGANVLLRVGMDDSIQVVSVPGTDLDAILGTPDGLIYATTTETTDVTSHELRRIAPNGEDQLVSALDRDIWLDSLALGADGRLWYMTMQHAGAIDLATGAMTRYPVRSRFCRKLGSLGNGMRMSCAPGELTSGLGSSLWFIDRWIRAARGGVGRIAPDGTLRTTRWKVGYDGLQDIVAGPGGAAWVSTRTFKLYRISKSGRVSRVALPRRIDDSGYSGGLALAAADARTLWMLAGENVARIRLP